MNSLSRVTGMIGLGFCALAAAPACAAPITYTVSGTFVVSLGSTPLPADIVSTGIGDTNDVLTGSAIYVPLSSLVANVSLVGDVTATDSYDFFLVNGSNLAGIWTHGTHNIVFQFTDPSLGSYDGISNFGPQSVTNAGGGSVDTDYGTVSLLGATNLHFAAAVASVPEPSSWMLLVAGFGLAGLALRSRATGRNALA